jgi:hypothetical protein
MQPDPSHRANPAADDATFDATAEGRVSVWIGATIDETDLNECFRTDNAEGLVDCEFSRTFGLHWIDPDYLEICFETPPAPIAALLAGASFAESFGPAVEAAAEQLHLFEATAAVLLFDVNYAPPGAPPDHPFVFVGSFAYELDAEESSR